MKWNGIVSQLGQSSIAARFAAANANHAHSTALRRSQPIPAMPHRFDRSLGAQLPAQPPDAHVHDVRARIEVISPYVREQALTADDLALVDDEVVQQPELPVRELRDDIVEPGLPSGEVEGEAAHLHHVAVLVGAAAPELRMHA